MDIKRICRLVEERKDELFELLCSLIKINSETFGSYGNEEECARYIYDLCQKMGLETEIYSPLDIDDFENHPDYFPGRGLENRYNVTAVWKGKKDENELMLMGHIDTVEIGDIANWEFDPLLGEVRDGKILGRGACDNKYALAVIMFLIRILKDAGFEPAKNLVFSAYCDEELGGSHGALASVLKHKCNRIVNMDGREHEIWNSASGGQVATYRYRTNEPVDSAKITASAIPVVMEELSKFGERREAELEANRFYAGTIIPGTSMRYMEVRAGNNGMDMGVGEIQFTYYTDKTKEEIYAEFDEMKKILDEKLAPLGMKGDGFIPYTRFFHYGFCEPDCKDITDMLEASREAIGTQPVVCGSCLSDLSVILKHGNTNAYAFGAGRAFYAKGGSHQPNEYIECDELVGFAKVIGAYVLKVLG